MNAELQLQRERQLRPETHGRHVTDGSLLVWLWHPDMFFHLTENQYCPKLNTNMISLCSLYLSLKSCRYRHQTHCVAMRGMHTEKLYGWTFGSVQWYNLYLVPWRISCLRCFGIYLSLCRLSFLGVAISSLFVGLLGVWTFATELGSDISRQF